MVLMDMFFEIPEVMERCNITRRTYERWRSGDIRTSKSHARQLKDFIRRKYEMWRESPFDRRQLQAQILKRLAQTYAPGTFKRAVELTEAKVYIAHAVINAGGEIEFIEIREIFEGHPISMGTVYKAMAQLGMMRLAHGYWKGDVRSIKAWLDSVDD